MIVIGGFAADALENAEKIVQDMLAGVGGIREVDMAGSKQDIALASFDTPKRPCNSSGLSGPTQSWNVKILGLLKIGPAQKGCVAKLSAKCKSFCLKLEGLRRKISKWITSCSRWMPVSPDGICWSPLSTGMVSFHGCMTMCRGLQFLKHGGNGIRTWWHTGVHREKCGIGPAEYPRATNDATLQPEFIRLHVLTKNLQSIPDQSRWEDLLAEFEVCDCDARFFTDTWRSNRQECFEVSSKGRLFLSSGGSRQGVGIRISAGLRRLIEDVSFYAYSSRVCLLNFFICALKISMLSVYFPTSWDDASKIESMYVFLYGNWFRIISFVLALG